MDEKNDCFRRCRFLLKSLLGQKNLHLGTVNDGGVVHHVVLDV